MNLLLLTSVLTLIFWTNPTLIAADQPLDAAINEPAIAYPAIQIQNPLNDTLFPPEMPPPKFTWTDAQPGANAWRVQVQLADAAAPIRSVVAAPEWLPPAEIWEQVKKRSLEKAARVTIAGFDTNHPGALLSRATINIQTSKDEVGASLFYREVNLPFAEAVKDPSKIRWRFGSIASPQPPPIVLENLPVCGNCHSFSRSGEVMGMDVDYANSKGSYVITRTSPKMALLPKDVITWDDFRREDGELTFGLLSQVSPDGKWVVSTVKDKSVFVPRPDLYFSQLFFPIKGILAAYNREQRTFSAVPGADDDQYVQSNPVWSPDGAWLLFARTRAYSLSNTVGQGKVLLTPDECREFLKDGKPFRFDIYRLPFNEGKGGKPEPLAGASDNGLSNYFPRYSPDGKWIVFCRAANYMLLQPDSELFIIPAQGGPARRLRANTSRMNSWHSWSPNSRWLVFSSKANSPYTQLCLTHIDEQGDSTPPVLLAHLTAPDRAANIPEFVPLPPGGIAKIQSQFLNDYSYERAGNEFYRSGDSDRAIEKYRQTLELNSDNANAHQKLGFLLYNVKHQFQEGIEHTKIALRLNPNNGFAHCDLGMSLLNQDLPEQALPHLQAALEAVTFSNDIQYKPPQLRFYLGRAFMQLGRFAEAGLHLEESVRLEPSNPDVRYMLALALACQGQIEEPVKHWAEAIKLRPGIDGSAVLHDRLAANYAKAGRFTEAVQSAEHALLLARNSGKNDLAQAIADRLVRYRANAGGKP
jgi:Tfp pilus assembly protein PilF